MPSGEDTWRSADKVVVVDFIDRNEKASRETNKIHSCQIAKIQQTLIKVQSHKITNHKQNSG